MGLSGLAVLLFCRYLLGQIALRLGVAPSRAEFLVRLMPIVVVVLATVAVHIWDLDSRHGVQVVGDVATGFALPVFYLPDASALRALAVPALTLAFIGTVQNIAMAQALAVKRRERIDANQELIGLGAANVVAAFSGGMPVGGGLSRTAVNQAAGAQTPLASIVSGIAMLVILLAGTSAFAKLPLSILAASIVAASFSMVELRAFHRAWSYDRADAIALAGTALGVLMLGLQAGIAIGIGLSLAVLLFRTSTPHIAVVGRIAGTEHFRNVERHGVQTLPGVLFLRVDESLFFGNLRAVQQRLSHELELAPTVHDLVLIMNAVNRIDLTAMESLLDLNRDLTARHICLHLAEVKGPVHDRLAKTPLPGSLSGGFYRSAHDAFEALRQQPSLGPSAF
jgi:SulP family sulfate permease